MAKKKLKSDNSASTNPPARKRDTANGIQTQSDSVSNVPTFEQISEAAYHRYVQRGGQDGHDFDDWLDAERSLRSR